ncbi:hypothetical protein K490DRAFT_61716 [Saccharata proteae CBS 121410]|uniref:mRNA N(6)-methyladenine demethylase n=1 Tax=Saccharata proteae CBS 121410 TaxID=1314787 RepID=A0A9P4M0G8_9PEZI|nr:hypothetical protein K490DRAFT_61716 [Saccharata proteae CBS 121410]
MGDRRVLDAHQRPPDCIRHVYKRYQKMKAEALDHDPDLLDLCRDGTKDHLRQVRVFSQSKLDEAFRTFETHGPSASNDSGTDRGPNDGAVSVYEDSSIPGLHIVPALLPPHVQRTLLERLIHRDLSNQVHQTNVHLHYDVPYPDTPPSFFSTAPSSEPLFSPKDPTIHKPLSITQFLSRKLRWVTLGGQYDWTHKVYPSSTPPPFPPDIGTLLEDLFPDMKAQAAIVNFYSPGDTLSMHRDVSEECERGLVSISIGCDGIFVIGLGPSDSEDAEEDDGQRILAVRLRSGDAVYMSGPSRFAWHGVPQIVPNTCPSWLQDWPAMPGIITSPDDPQSDYSHWKGWMTNKRINLNVRQMFD